MSSPLNDRYVSINGIQQDNPATASISIFDTSFHRGDGVFEVMKITTTVDGKRVVRSIEHHLQRLQTSADAVGCPLPSKFKLLEWIGAAVEATLTKPLGSLRLIATKGTSSLNIEPSFIINWNPLPSWPETFTLKPILAPWHPAGLPGWETPIKWTSYGPNVVSSQMAKSEGFTDALLLSPHRVTRKDSWTDVNLLDLHVLDGPNFAICFVETSTSAQKDILHMPCPETLGLLPSITQKSVAKIAVEKFGMKVQQGVYTLGEMQQKANEIFVMSTTRGVKTVTKIGDYEIQKPSTHPSWVSQFAEELEKL